MKKYNHGMVLGKFYPPHNGHLFLIEEALKQSNFVTVFVCSLKSEIIPGKLRYEWMNEIYIDRPNIRIVWIQKELPQTPEEHGDIDDFYKLWCDVVNNKTSNLDVLFTSENYGDEFASYLGIKHVLVDLERLTHSVSATSIRENPIKNWKHIPDIIKPYFQKSIVIMGPESTGKSTLTKKLSKHFGGNLVKEYGREYTDEIPAKEMDVKNFEKIAVTHEKQIKTINEFSKKSMMFVDTDALTTYIFGSMYLGDSFYSEKIMNLIMNRDYDLVLLCDIDVPWVDDGTRDFPTKRKKHLKKLKRGMELLSIKYEMVRGDYDQRFKNAIKIVENKFKI